VFLTLLAIKVFNFDVLILCGNVVNPLKAYKRIIKLLSPSGQNRQKKQSEGVRFYYFGTQNTVPYCQKYTPTDCFLGDFARWRLFK